MALHSVMHIVHIVHNRVMICLHQGGLLSPSALPSSFTAIKLSEASFPKHEYLTLCLTQKMSLTLNFMITMIRFIAFETEVYNITTQ